MKQSLRAFFQPLNRVLLRRLAAGGMMLFANSQAMCTSFKQELLLGAHQFGSVTIVSRTSLTAPTIDSFKAALYLVSGSLGAGTTAYSATSEVSGTGYTAGGIAVPAFTAPTTSGTTAYTTPSGSLVYSTVTLSTAFDTVLIYNSTQSNRAVSVHTFGSQTVTAANFTLTMPTNAAGTALLNLA